MLILGRKVGEEIIIGPDVTLVVLGIDRGSVRLGIKAPQSVTILRGEIVVAIEEANRGAVPTEAPAWAAVLAPAASVKSNAADAPPLSSDPNS